MKEPIHGFDAPQQLPQMASEEELAVAQLIFEAPPWSPTLAPELLHLIRSHVAIRSALGFGLEMANQKQQALLTSSDPIEVYRAQGAIQALQLLFNNLMTDLAAVDKGKKETTQ